MLREWVKENGMPTLTPDQLLLRTHNDTRPRGSNWARAWHRMLESVGQKQMRVYDCRRAVATTWLRAGMPSANSATALAQREMLVSTYVGALNDEEQVDDQQIDSILG